MLELSGLEALRRRLTGARSKGEKELAAATQEALDFVEARARDILDAEVYSKPHSGEDGPNKSDPDSLYASFFQELTTLARSAASGRVGNSSGHAKFLEFGTDNEGTGSHFVPVVNGKALHWMNGASGHSAYSKGHMVKGITPIRFLERALKDHQAEVLAIYHKHFADLFD